jgi:hypothetical protein
MKHRTSERARVGAAHQPEVRGSLRCRVCWKAMRPDEQVLEVAYRGAHYPVCCPSCAAKFRASPGEFLSVGW